jgi:predicted RNase H-like nuclease (RuvC/YqgF family)
METNHTSDPQISLSRLTKADLEKKIHHLTEALQVSQEQETALQAQVVQLELALETQKHSIQELQTSLTQAQSLKPELERVRADALALAQENERLQAQLKSVKQGTVNLKPPVQQPARTPVGRSPKVVPIPSRSILDRPVMPNHPPNQTGKASKGFDTWCYD